MINHIQLKFGSSPDTAPLGLSPTAITVFVGPNNSGKSKVIAEIAHQCLQGTRMTDDVILDSVMFDSLDSMQIEDLIGRRRGRPPAGQGSPGPDHIWFRNRYGEQQAYLPALRSSLAQPNNLDHRTAYATFYSGPGTLVLNGSNRIALANDQSGGDLQQPALTSFQHLFRNDSLRAQFSAVVHKSLNSYAVIDPTNLGQLRLRLSAEPPATADLERGLGEASVTFHAAAQHIALASDGAKAFTGILAEIFAGDPEILLMDEPEAFLHPALAFNLGREIARSLAESDKRMFVSTHSPQFLMGCIQSGVPVNVVRLTHRGGVATARLLPSEEITRLMRNPLLRSANVIAALFYESVVVTEADPDRAFYQEINERLLRQGRGIPNCIFLNAQNKQTIPFIVGPLRRLGIASAAIYDVDFIKDGKSVATRFMQSAGVPEIAQQGLTTTRAALLSALEKNNSLWKESGGINTLNGNERAAADDYFDHLDAYGAFVVRGGELESWLGNLNVAGHGPGWLISMFEKMGEDPSHADYLHPDQTDVWAFIDRVAAWLADPGRKGIPA